MEMMQAMMSSMNNMSVTINNLDQKNTSNMNSLREDLNNNITTNINAVRDDIRDDMAQSTEQIHMRMEALQKKIAWRTASRASSRSRMIQLI